MYGYYFVISSLYWGYFPVCRVARRSCFMCVFLETVWVNYSFDLLWIETNKIIKNYKTSQEQESIQRTGEHLMSKATVCSCSAEWVFKKFSKTSQQSFLGTAMFESFFSRITVFYPVTSPKIGISNIFQVISSF